jgi:hypothetical protein
MRGRQGLFCLGLIGILLPSFAFAHAIGGKDAAFVAASHGAFFLPFVYLGAKHMVTGYDHLLFLFGVIFFLHRLKEVALYVTLFSIGHSVTLLSGVVADLRVNSYLVDAIIGVSVAWKGFDNLSGFQNLFGVQPNNRLMVLCFGLVHGFGLATKLQALRMPSEGLFANLASFNLGVELGQLMVLSFLVVILALLRGHRVFGVMSSSTNVVLIFLGFLLAGYQLAGYFYAGQML